MDDHPQSVIDETKDNLDNVHQPLSESAQNNLNDASLPLLDEDQNNLNDASLPLLDEAQNNLDNLPQPLFDGAQKNLDNTSWSLFNEPQINVDGVPQALYQEAKENVEDEIQEASLDKISPSLSNEVMHTLKDIPQPISADTENNFCEKPHSVSDESDNDLSDEANNYLDDFQDFDKEVPDNLLDIDIPTLDLKDIDVDTDEHGDWILLASGGCGEIYTGHLLSSGEKVTLKLIQDNDFQQDLKEANIQAYLSVDVFVPKVFGLIGGPKNRDIMRVKGDKKADKYGKGGIMIIQQFCAKGKVIFIHCLFSGVNKH